MTFYAALDVSLRTVAICIVDQDGAIRLERSVRCELPDILRVLGDFGEPLAKVGFEAGVMTQHLTYGLRAAGHEVVCMEARQVSAALAAMRNKTDKNDARGIAHILRTGWYSRVHVKSMASHYVRALLASRKAIFSKCIDLENEVRGLLKVFGIRLPPRVYHSAFDGEARKAIEGDAALVEALAPMLDVRLALLRAFRDLDARVKRLAREDEVCTRLMTVPGVGPLTALIFKAAVDDPARFTSSRTVGAHFGLTPRRFQSGETDNPGRISRAGDADVRAALYTAANSMLTRSIRWSWLKAWGARLIKTKGRRRAVVAVARKLAVVLHRMWADQTDFRGSNAEAAPMS
jgi:transposase